MRPTVGQISSEGVLPLSTTIDTVGWFAHDAVTLRRAGESLLSPKKDESGNAKRLLIAVDAFALVSNTVSEHLHGEALEKIRQHFSNVEEIRLEQFDLTTLPMHLDHVRAWEATRFYSDWMSKTSPNMAPDIKLRFEASSKITKEQHDQSLIFIDELRDKLNSLLGSEHSDLPTNHGRLTAQSNMHPRKICFKNRLRNLNLTSLASVARLPQVSIPFTLKPGWKHGISLLGSSFSDSMLLSLAVAIAE